MAIRLEEYNSIFSRSGRPTTGDDGFELSESDEKAFDKAWSSLAEKLGVKPLPDQPSKSAIRELYESQHNTSN